MTFHSPDFWYQKSGLLSTVLSPLGCAYHKISQLKQNSTKSYHSKIPVICVGNITMGGSGKTPSVLSLIKIIKENKLCDKPCVLSRGYGGTKDVHLVTAEDSAETVGDEPKLMSHHVPVIVSKNRAEGAKLAEKHDFDLIIMDDGFQNQTLHKDYNFLVVDGTLGFGNQKVFPAGPLRETIQSGIRRTNSIILINDDARNLQNVIKDTPVFKANIAVTNQPENFKGKDYIAFCGIAHPSKFLSTLQKDLSISVLDFKTYPDHYVYEQTDIDALISTAKTKNVRLITTEKDFIKLDKFKELQELTDIVSIELDWNNKNLLVETLSGIIRKNKA